MISDHNITTAASIESHGWSNRFFTLAVAGILFLTMYPFEISHAKPYRDGSPLFLGGTGKLGGPLDVFLNVLLFMPFGFALGTKILRRGKSWKTALIYTTLAGALFSYAIEVTQLYVPFRDSGWEDVFTNTTGSLLGCVAALVLGIWLFGHLTSFQQTLRDWLSPRRLASVFLLYFGIWFVASAFLATKASLADWRTDCFLVFANDATGRHAWDGHLLQVQIWNRALPKSTAERLTSTARPLAVDDAIVNFDFGNEGSATSGSGASTTSKPPQDKPSVTSASPTLSDYVANSLKQANQFSIRAVLIPAASATPSGRILSLTRRSGFSDFDLMQQNDDLIFWFRSPLTSRWKNLNSKIADATATKRVHTVLFSYNGSVFSSYMDGKEVQSHAIGAQTALASYIRDLKEPELEGYRDVFYALVFFPAGALLGIAIARSFSRRRDRFVLALLGVLLPAVLLEWIVRRASAGPFSLGNVAFSAMYIVLGLVWMNVDGPLPERQARA
jgi:VanZ like family